MKIKTNWKTSMSAKLFHNLEFLYQSCQILQIQQSCARFSIQRENIKQDKQQIL